MLVKAATLAGGLIASGKLDEQTVISALEDAVRKLPNVLDFNAARRTIRTQIEFGKLRPVSDADNPQPKYKAERQSDTEWQEPVPLKKGLLPVLPMEPDMIPEPFRDWLTDIAHRMGCPLDYMAAAAVVMLSSLIGTRITVKPKSLDDWTIVANVWGVIIGEPATMKTPSIAEVLKPLDQLIDESIQEHEKRQLCYQAQQATYEAQKKVFQSNEQERMKGKPVNNPVDFPEAPQKPTERRFMTSDATIEKLGELLNENPTGLLQYRDELTGLFASWDKAGHEADRAFYLEAWNGNGGCSIDRIGRGTMHIKKVCVSLLGGIQPTKLLRYLEAATGYENDGFVQRLQLAVYPDKETFDYRDKQPNEPARDRAFLLIRNVVEMNMSLIGSNANEHNRSPYIRFEPEAQTIFKEWLIKWETEILAVEVGLLVEHFTKFRSLMPSLALIFHVINCADANNNQRAISVEATQMAVRWCTYLMSHARRIYGLLDTASVEGAERILAEARKGKLTNGFKIRDVVQRGWSHLKTTEQVAAAIAELTTRHWIRESHAEFSGTGRPEASTYQLHPSLIPNA